MITYPETLERWANGDHLEDLELIFLYDAYKKVNEATLVFGDRYFLVCDDARRNAEAARGFLEARGYGKKKVTV
jgi:rhodanese-related sulfurtransferase